MDPTTPAATIRWGTTPRQRTVVGTLADIAQRVADAQLAPPALTIIGRVVSLRETMNWFERRPLFGQTIVVTRTRQEASELTERLDELGAEVIEAPTIEIAAGDPIVIRAALESAKTFDWIVFTSANGAHFTREQLDALGLDVRALGGAKIAVVGSETAAAVWEHLRLRADVCPDRPVAEALAEELIARNAVEGKRFLLLRADIARPVLVDRLRQAGSAEVRDVAIYETKPVASLPQDLLDALGESRVSWVTFTSSSTATNLASLLGENYRDTLEGVKLASIGPITTATLRELGLDVARQAENASIDGLVDAIRGAM